MSRWYISPEDQKGLVWYDREEAMREAEWLLAMLKKHVSNVKVKELTDYGFTLEIGSEELTNLSRKLYGVLEDLEECDETN